jgi:hypothetical protein
LVAAIVEATVPEYATAIVDKNEILVLLKRACSWRERVGHEGVVGPPPASAPWRSVLAGAR